jgi:1,2-phenylacetyl-CoA epoxidase catalytic subunit
MMNERMNCTHISKSISDLPDDTTPEEMYILSKQALDEAKHFKMLVGILEHLNGAPIDIEACIKEMRVKASKSIEEGGGLRPAHIMEKYESSKDPLCLALYQYIGEGRAARNWKMIAETATDPFLAKEYKIISRDEDFHSKIGKKKLEELCISEEVQSRADKIADDIIDDLFTLGIAKRYYIEPELINLNSCPKSYYK